MSHNSDGGEEIGIILLLVFGVILLAGGVVYALFTDIATALGDCKAQFQEGLLVNGYNLIFEETAAPAFVEGVKISMGLLGITGVVMLGITWWWNKKQETGRYGRTSQRESRLKIGSVLVGSCLVLIGFGTAVSISLGAETACVAGAL